MNKILTLYNIEFKRIYKLYFALLGVLAALNVAIVGIKLFERINIVSEMFSIKPYLGLLKTQEAKKMLLEYDIPHMYFLSNMALGGVVLLCLVYAIAIWYRDFLGKSKTAYTLFMLPNNKFDIYIAKAIMMVVIIYGTMLAQIMMWLISTSVISMLTGINVGQIKDLFVHGVRSATDFHLIQPYPIDFIMINILGVMLAVVVIFTGVMIQMVYKKKGIILGILYILGIVGMYIGTTAYSGYSDVFLIKHIIFYIFTFVLSIGLSYHALNKRIYM